MLAFILRLGEIFLSDDQLIIVLRLAGLLICVFGLEWALTWILSKRRRKLKSDRSQREPVRSG
jgi:hypothetical protein